MHSTSVQSGDFEIEWRGEALSHADYFADITDTDRVGVVIPGGLEGLGAATLIMGCVTAFYDRYRARGGEFFAYPDYFTFQSRQPCADYRMFDIWPGHKNVYVPADPQKMAEAITSRGITILLVPDGEERPVEIAAVELASAARTIRRCFAYGGGGETAAADLVISCESGLLREWGQTVFASLPACAAVEEARAGWEGQTAGELLRQTFRQLELTDALRLL